MSKRLSLLNWCHQDANDKSLLHKAQGIKCLSSDTMWGGVLLKQYTNFDARNFLFHMSSLLQNFALS